MRKLLPLSVLVLLGIVLFSSCKKDYTCQCTANGVSSNYVYENVKKSDAEDLCNSQQATWQLISSSATCSI